MPGPSGGDVSRQAGAVDESTASQVWVGHLRPANDAAGSLILVAAASMDKTCQTVIREVRAQDEKGVIVAVCTGGLEQKVLALKAGADDCIAVPHGFIAVLKVLETLGVCGRRLTDRAAGPHRVTANQHTYQVTADGNVSSVSPMEFRLLLELQKQRGKVVSHQHLEDLLWGNLDGLSHQALKQLARRLRRRLGAAGDSVVLVRGKGYMLT